MSTSAVQRSAATLLLFTAVGLAGCSGAGGTWNDGTHSGGATLVVEAGPDQTVANGMMVTLDGSGSHDAAGGQLAFFWELVSRPAGSVAALSNATDVAPSFVADLEGAYVVRLTVASGSGIANDTVTITAGLGASQLPVVNAATTVVAYVGDTVVLDARASDPDGEPLTYAWALVTKPDGSAAALSGESTATPSIVPDAAGAYLLSLDVSDTSGAAATVTVTVRAYPPIVPLAHRVLDAEYSKALDAIVMVDEGPNALYVYDPVAKTEKRVLLSLTPTAVSVSPDGLFAVVGHNAWISYVDLSAATLVKTIPVSAVLGDVVFAANGYAYIFPTTPSFDTIHAVNLATGAETKAGGFIGFEGTRAKLAPGGTAIYGADNNVSPADIRKFDISGGATVTGYDSPYHGDYAMCGDLWLSEDGARIFTACGNTFRATSTRATDMTYAGALEATPSVRHLADSTVAAEVMAIPGVSYWSGTGHEDEVVRIYGADFLTQKRTVALSPFLVQGKVWAGHGRYVFWSADATRRLAIVQADPDSAMLKDFAVVSF